jgi:GH15 family glucan-1,4-alpha-glucosidase
MDMESAAPQAVLNRLADLAARRWHRPDNSIWEVRGRRAHHTYSHLMCWLALDRAVDLAAHGALAGDSARWAAQRDAARQAILERAWDPILGPSPARSAAATSTPPPSSPRSSGSSRPTTPVPLHTPGRDRPPRRQRAPAPVLPRRRTRGRDAAFLLCTLWLADTHTVEGDPDRGEELLERVLATGNDLGLLAEEADPATGAPLGNFPQGLTHLAVIESVHRLAGAP